MYQRSLLLVVAFLDGALAWQRSWGGFAVGLVVALWLALDDRAIDRLDADAGLDDDRSID